MLIFLRLYSVPDPEPSAADPEPKLTDPERSAIRPESKAIDGEATTSATNRNWQGKLTPREREVLRLIALGHTSVEVAETLGLSPRTIETHRARIHRKLGLTKRSELVSYALQHDMLRP